MLPGVSAEDCLVADLGVDPGEHGWQSWEATGFLLRGFRPDPTAGSCSGRWTGSGSSTGTVDPDPRGLQALAEVLGELYPPEHELIFYRASSYPIRPGEAVRMPLRELAALESPPAPTLYVPPLPSRPVDRAMAARIGVTLS